MLGCTVHELAQRMTVAEFEEWKVMERMEGLGPDGANRRHAALMAASANGPLIHPQKSAWGSRDFFPQDPWVQDDSAESSKPAESLRDQVSSINSRFLG